MSQLAPIRRIPPPSVEEGSVEADLNLLREACRSMARRDELICSLSERGVSVKQLTEITGLRHQRIYQIRLGTNGHEPRAAEDAQNGNGSTGDTGG